jgi:Fur family ferric uptake transcriptional regulator
LPVVAAVDIDGILQLIKERGGRVTTPRRAIVTALLAADHHTTAEELADRVQAAHPDVHRSTIYRTLETLAELGVVEHVHLGHGPAVFHLAHDAHHHLICRSCGAVVEAPPGLLSAVGRRVREEYGFELDAKHFALSGLCSACRP